MPVSAVERELTQVWIETWEVGKKRHLNISITTAHPKHQTHQPSALAVPWCTNNAHQFWRCLSPPFEPRPASEFKCGHFFKSASGNARQDRCGDLERDEAIAKGRTILAIRHNWFISKSLLNELNIDSR